MKLKNKKTGEIIETDFELSVSIPDDEKLYGNDTYTQIKGYSSIKELSEEWEDYEEPKEYWYIDWNGEVCRSDIHDERTEQMKQIGNFSKTEEEAEKAEKKLQAWKRLKDKGFRFNNWAFNGDGANCTDMVFDAKLKRLSALEADEMCEDLDLLFCTEDN